MKEPSIRQLADTGLLSLSPSLLRPPGYGGQAGTGLQRILLNPMLTRIGSRWIQAWPKVVIRTQVLGRTKA